MATVAVVSKAAVAETACSFTKFKHFQSVGSKSEIETAVSDMIKAYQVGEHQVNWGHLSRCFENLGADFTVESILGGGFDHGDIFRFTLDKTNLLTPSTSIPGGSNDDFTAIINVDPNGTIGIVRRGRTLEMLD